jgi:hypothetical protein
MKTISQIVEEEIRRTPFLEEILSEGLGNTAQIARRIKESIEKRRMQNVSESAIAMALHRMEKRRNHTASGLAFLKQIRDISVRSNLVEVIYPNTTNYIGVSDAFMALAKSEKDAFVNFSRGVHESLIIVSNDLMSALPEVAQNKQLRIQTGLSAITMHLPKTSLDVPGLYYPILKALAHEGISFVEVMSVDLEFTILFRDSDIDRAFSVIKRMTS